MRGQQCRGRQLSCPRCTFFQHARHRCTIVEQRRQPVTDRRQPADQFGDKETNAARENPYDRVLTSTNLDVRLRTFDLWGYSYANGIVYDTRITWASGLPPPHLSAQDIVWIEGYLLEPSGFNAAGEPVALNFATGELDTRQLRHPDGVILDIGTHVLAMLRETLLGCRGDVTLDLAVRVVKDRLGRDIAHGDMVTAEGEAHLQGRLGDIPLNIWLNKYAGPAGGQKGMRIGLRDGRMLALDRAPDGEVATLQDGERIQRWTRPGAIYAHCLDEQILGAENVFTRATESVAGLTRRRLEEVEWLLRLQQQLRGPH